MVRLPVHSAASPYFKNNRLASTQAALSMTGSRMMPLSKRPRGYLDIPPDGTAMRLRGM
jgi:hypothetical protein